MNPTFICSMMTCDLTWYDLCGWLGAKCQELRTLGRCTGLKIFAYNLLLDVAVIDTCILSKGVLRGMNSEAYPYFFLLIGCYCQHVSHFWACGVLYVWFVWSWCVGVCNISVVKSVQVEIDVRTRGDLAQPCFCACVCLAFILKRSESWLCIAMQSVLLK